jgi:hypothetical protein
MAGRHAIRVCAVSQRIRKRIEEGFGWMKEIALKHRARHRGKARVGSAGSSLSLPQPTT